MSELVGFDQLLEQRSILQCHSTKMDMQQMLELLLANQKKAETNRESNQKQMLAEISTRMDANTKEMNATQERMNTNLNEMREEIKSNQAEMRSTVCIFRSELEAIQHEMKAVIQPIWSELDETTACNRD
jgi:hypothetical protein